MSRPATPWRAAPAAGLWLFAGLVLVLLGLLAGRHDIVALGVAPILGSIWALLQRPGRPSTVALRAGEQMAGSGQLNAVVQVTGGAEPDLLTVRVTAPGHRPAEALLIGRDRDFAASMTTVRTGRRPVFALEVRHGGPDQLQVSEPTWPEPLTLTVLPSTSPLSLAPLPIRLQGLTGSHPSRRPGHGTDLHDVAAFTPGDRLRRINWPATARLNTGPTVTTLYVRRTMATADATVMVVVDSRDEIGPRVSTWGDATQLSELEASSLDIARVAAASIARHYLSIGDRVGLDDLGRLRRPTPPAGGHRQLDRLVHRLALSQPEGEPMSRSRVPRLTSGALIVLCSTFLDDEPGRLAQAWQGAGHRVVAVNTLPRLELAGLNPRASVAFRVVSMEREDRLDRLTSAGIELVAWPTTDDPATARTALAILARQRPR